MKRRIYFILLAWLMLISIVLASCGEQSPHDDSGSLSEHAESKSKSETSNDEDSETADAHETEQTDPNFEWVLLPNETYGISKLLNTSATEITIPESYRGKPVTKIMSRAFAGASRLTTLVIKENIKEIENGALSGCSVLKELTLPFVGTDPSSTNPIGFVFGTTPYTGAQKVDQSFKVSDGERYDSFYIPSALEKVTIIGGVVHTYAFMDCGMIREVVLGDGVTAVESGAFYFCDRLESITMGKGITQISEECFLDLTALKRILIGENVTQIGYNAFSGCSSLKSIVIPEKVTVIEKYAFDGCTAMESIVFEHTSGWYRDYGSASGTGMNVTDPSLNARNLTDSREYSSDRWKRR